MITFGKTKQDKDNELLERTPVINDGVPWGEIVSNPINHQYCGPDASVSTEKVYNTIEEAMIDLI